MAQLSSIQTRSGQTSGAARPLIVILWLAVAAVAASCFLAAVGAFDLSKLGLGNNVQNAILLSILGKAGEPLAAVLWLVVGVGALLLIARGSRRGSSAGRGGESHVLAMDEHGWVVIAKQGVATVAEAAIERVKGVVQARVSVSGDGSSPVRLSIHALVHAGAQQRQAGDELRRRAEQAVTELVGLEVTEVGVKIEVVPPEKLSRLIQ